VQFASITVRLHAPVADSSANRQEFPLPIVSLRVVPLLIIGAALTIGSGTAVAADASGLDLPNDSAGSFGPLGDPLKALIGGQLDTTGLGRAAALAQTAITDLAHGRVPVISDLEDPFHGDVGAALDGAFSQAQAATGILGAIDPAAAQAAFDLLRNSPLLTDGDIGFSTPVSRTRILRKGAELSVCTTVVGPGGARITSGMSNAAHLCGVLAPRMANPGGALVLVTDLAVGYTHVQTRLPLLPNLSGNLLATPQPLLQGETYVKVNGQWLQLKLTGADPSTVTVEVTITIGVKAGVNYALYLEGEGAVTLTFNVKPFLAAEVIGGVAAAVKDALLAQNLTPTDVLNPDVAGAALLAGITHLNNDPLLVGQDLGYVQIVIDAVGQLGVGISDTGLAGASVGGNLTTTIPLGAVAQLGASELANLIRIGLGASDTVRHLSQGLLEGQDPATLQQARDAIGAAALDLVTQALPPILNFTDDVEVEFGFKLGVLGRVGKGTSDSGETKAPKNIQLINHHVNIPVGKLARLITDPNALAAKLQKAIDAASKIVMYAVGQASAAGIKLTDDIDFVNTPPLSGTNPAPSIPTVDDFTALTGGLLDDVRFTFLSMGAPLTLTGVRDVSLGALLNLLSQQAPLVGNIVTGIVRAASTGDFDALRGALEQAATDAVQLGLTEVIEVLKTYKLPLSIGFGGNVDLGAGAVAKLGLGGKVDGELKLSLLLLLINSPAYNEPDGTTLASLDLPVAVSLTAGASLGSTTAGGGASLTVDAGGTLSADFLSLTLKQWNGALPPPAAMKVAGFEVLDFSGTVNQDESFAGDGFLLLPMGGLVHAFFSVDAQGHVLPGATWTGGFELGPLGTLTLAQGTLDDDGIHGVINVKMLDSSFLADFLLQSTGRLYGHFAGTLNAGGLQLANVTVDLGRNGSFAGHSLVTIAGNTIDLGLTVNPDGTSTGHYSGDLVLAGRTWSSASLDWDGTGFTGTSSTNILGNSATFLLHIGADGSFSGTYRQGAGEVFGLGGLGLQGVVLSATAAGFSGSGALNLPGVGSYDLTDLSIDAHGHVGGTLKGSTSLFGFDTALTLNLSETGLTGSASLSVLGSNLQATDLSIDAAGRVRGTFSGSFVSGGQTISVSSLVVGDDSLTGTTHFDIPGVTAAQVSLTLKQGEVTARYESVWNLYGVGSALAEFTLYQDRIVVRAQMQDDFMQTLRALVLKTITDAVAGGQADLAFARSQVAKAQADVDNINVQIAATFDEINREKAAARKVVEDAEAALNGAFASFLGVLDQIAAVNARFAAQLGSAQNDLQNARNDVNNARSALGVLDDRISGLDNWYWGLNDSGRFWNWLYYQGARAALVVSRGVVSLALDAADGFLSGVQYTLGLVESALLNELQPLLQNQALRQQALDDARSVLAFGRQTLESIPLDPEFDPRIIGLRIGQGTATLALNFANGLLNTASQFLGGIVVVADFIDSVGAAALIDVRAARFEADLGTLTNGRVLMDADVVYMNQATHVSFTFDFFNPLGGAAEMAKQLTPALQHDQTPPGQQPAGGWNDSVPPTVSAFAPSGWQRGDTAITLRALDSVSGVAAIVFSADGAQPIGQTTVAADSATLTIAAEGVTTVTYTARDRAGNTAAAQTIAVSIDRTGAVASASAPDGWQKDRALVQISATDSGSGVASIAYSASGAQTIGLATVSASTATVEVAAEGVTTVQYSATDVAGNAGLTGQVTVKVDRTAPVSTLQEPRGWRNAPVDVAVTAQDALSGVASISWSATGAQGTSLTSIAGASGNIHIANPGVTTVTWFATDKAGNAEAPRTFTVKIDTLPPTVSGSAPSAWQNNIVVAALSAVDELGGSGVASITVSATGAQPIALATIPGDSTTVAIVAEGVTTVYFSATDNAGNVSATQSLTVRVDLTNPVTTASAPSAWQKGTTTVALSATDNLSGVASITYSASGAQTIASTVVPGGSTSLSISAEGTTIVSYFATDIAGNVEAAGSITIRIDLTNPVTTATAPLAWQNRTTTVGLSATDNLSGVAFITYSATGAQTIASTSVNADSTSFPISAEGTTTVSYFATDVAGNVEAAGSIIIRIDLTKPVITFAGDRTYTVDQIVNVSCTTTDNLSGVASDTCAAAAVNAPAYTFDLGSHPVSATATDVATNVATATTGFTVIVTYPSLINLTTQFVTFAGTQNDLVAKLNAATASRARANKNAESGQIGAYRNAVSAQSGKRLTSAQAAILIKLANALLAQ
jgi:hypothetical protein